ncbi:MAG TPA: ATP-binding protein [Candidatus Saccharimonadales bacterium]|nr:ATP-binding protein [Candidatus Saccharimonadales bacterium]
MDYLQRLVGQAQKRLLAILLLNNLFLVAAWWVGERALAIKPVLLAGGLAAMGLGLAVLIATSLGKYLLQPLKALWQVILHLSPHTQSVAPPKLEGLRFGRELVATLSAQIYQLVSVADQTRQIGQKERSDLKTNFIATALPLPLFVLDDSETIQFANETAAQYIGIKTADLVGKNIYMVLDMAFPSESTFDKWLKAAKLHNATAVSYWERVRLNVQDNHPTRLFDLAAYYNKGNPGKIETMLVLFDHTKQYSQDEQAISFIALSVHELRTPLTLLRGYIEVFEEELAGKVSPELQDFITKMSASAQQLTAFVNNILNVARVEEDQLTLQLKEEDWAAVLADIVKNLELRAHVRGITLDCKATPNLPKVGVDRLSIYEVINNLVDNAIKYSGTSKVIKIDAHLTQDGLVETTVQDFGLGIPSSVMPNLFTKFYRDHRHRAQIGGTGLGLYLCKAIVGAHGGNIWIRSQEGKGSVFGFTLLPYAQLAEEVKNSDNKEIVRSAHGWIKNHSLYRR